jgi:nicotinamidase-related amidase
MLFAEDLSSKKRARINDLHRMIINRTALLVIDMQCGSMDPRASMAVPSAWDIVPQIQTMVDYCRKVAIPVIFTEFVAGPEVPCLRADPFGPEHLPTIEGNPIGRGLPSSNCNIGVVGPESPDIIDELKPRVGELVVQGYTLDKFYGTPLDLALRARDIRFLMFTGKMADLCLGSTLFSATNREYRVTALTDCITTNSPQILEMMFDIFGRKLARLMTSCEAIQELKIQLEVEHANR